MAGSIGFTLNGSGFDGFLLASAWLICLLASDISSVQRIFSTALLIDLSRFEVSSTFEVNSVGALLMVFFVFFRSSVE